MSKFLQARIDALSREIQRLETELAQSKQTEEELRQRERRYQLIFENTNVGLVQIGPDGRFVDVNSAFCELLGYTREELKLKTYLDITHPDDREHDQKLRQRLLAGELSSLRWEKRYIRKDGSVVWVSLNVSATSTGAGEGQGRYMMVAIENISERRTLQETLRRIASDLAKAEAITPTGTWTWDLQANEMGLSCGAAQILGLPPSQTRIPVALLFDRTPPEDRHLLDDAIRSSVSDDKPFQVEHRLSLPDGTMRLVLANGETDKRDTDGKPLTLIGMVQDITVRRQAESALQESEQRFRHLFDNAADGIFIANQDGTYIDVNANGCRMLGYSCGELLGKNIADLIPPSDVARLMRSKQRFLDERDFVEVEEWDLRRKDGSYLSTEISARMLPDGRWMAIVRDISERRRMQQELARHAAEISDLYDNAPCGYHSVDGDMIIVKINNTELEWLGYTREELVGKKRMPDLLTPASASIYRNRFPEIVERGVMRDLELELVCKDGSVMPVLLNSSAVVDAGGNFIMTRTTLFDITKMVQAQQELRRAAIVFEHTHDAILVTDASGAITAVNKAFSEITGYQPKEVIGKNPRVLKSERHDNGFYEQMWSGIEQKGSWQGELWDRKKSGELFPTWQSITVVKDETGKVTDYVSVFSDITSIKDTEAQLERLAYHDTLTGLPNRLLYTDRLDHALEYARRHNTRVGIMMLDLDRFKLINDTLGHSVGDQLLEVVAARLRENIRGEDTVARLGGDEFSVVISGLEHTEDAAVLAQKIIDSVAEPIHIGIHVLAVSVSIGISVFPEDGADKETLGKSADVALYAAKDKGRNCYEFFTPAMTQRATEVLAIDRGLRYAIGHNELVLFYQPKIHLASGRIVGIEALVRWNSPQLGMQSPDSFIPVAEESNLIHLLGEWVFDAACAQMHKWREAGAPPARLAINVSARQIKQNGFVEAIRKKMQSLQPRDGYGLDIEITESTLQTHPDIISALSELRPLGFRVAVDDFGTGFSSLHSLKQLPVDILKIDRAFIDGLPDDPEDKAITSAIIAMGHSLDMTIVAEGIETREQLEFLTSHHCDEVQGFLLSPPVCAEECEQLLIAGSRASLLGLAGDRKWAI
ncbi:MAG TPA: PAS domain S-box protein [Noviherbaspirillum sp.]|nr:PAS domain S-box protein [Noviherbaspirillum sp.]